MDRILYADFIGGSPKKKSFEDDLKVKFNYSCTYKIYNWDMIRPDKRKDYSPDVYNVEVDCEFGDYIPIARGIDYETFNAMNETSEKIIADDRVQFIIYIEPAWEIESWMLGDNHYDYFTWEVEMEQLERDGVIASIPILKGFSMYLRKHTDVSYEELDVEVKKRVKDLVEYFVAPRLKLLDNEFGINTYGKGASRRSIWFAPDIFLELEEDREMRIEKIEKLLELQRESQREDKL